MFRAWMRDWSGSRRATYLPELFLACLSVALFFSTWHRWVEYWGDAGYNLYTQWQLSEGRRLYTDVAYLHGPFSPLWNALVFRVLGVSILRLACTNLVLTWGIACLIYRGIARYCDALTALAASCFFLTGFAIVDSTPALSFNYIFPYKPELTHGVLAASFTFLALGSWIRGGGPRSAFALGFGWGFSELLSVEMFLALSAGILAALALDTFLRARRPVPELAAAAFGFAMPPFLMFLYFCREVPPLEAIGHAFGMFVWANATKGLAALPLYQNLSGFAEPAENLLSSLEVTAVVSLATFFLYGASRYTQAWPAKASIGAGALLGLLFLVPRHASQLPVISYPWEAMPRFFPFGLAILPGALLWRTRGRARLAIAEHERLIVAVGFVVYALALITKMILNPRFIWYGVLLCQPAALVMVAFFAHGFPAWAGRRGGDARFLRAFGLAAVGAMAISFVVVTASFASLRTEIFDRGEDAGFTWTAISYNDPGLILGTAVDWVRDNVRAGEKLQMFPDADIVNYLARRERALPYPVSAIMYRIFGEFRILAELREHPPEVIGVMSNETGAMSMGAFGVDPDFGVEIRGWIESNYYVAKSLGGNPFEPYRFGIRFYRRR